MLEDVSKAMALEKLPSKVKEQHAQFRRCRSCGYVYWKGSYYEHLRKEAAQVFNEVDSS